MGVSATVSTQDAAPSPTQLLSPQEQGWKLWTPGRVWKFGEVPGLGGNFLHRARGRDVGDIVEGWGEHCLRARTSLGLPRYPL